MKKRLLLLATAMMMAVITTFAVPAKPGLKKKVKLKDGSVVELTMKGDEHFSYYMDAAGRFCQLKDGELVTLTKEDVARKWTAQKQQRQNVNGAPMRRARRIGNPGTTTGTQRGLVILLQYKDVKFQNDSVTTNNIYKRFFNEEGYKDNGCAGSVRDYFIKQSYEKLTIDFDVVGPYTVANEMAYYGARYTDENGNDHNDIHPALMVREAVDAAEKDGLDFSQYDWDNNGEVNQVFVIYAGYAEAQGASAETIWPHEWVLDGEGVAVKYDGVWIHTYGCTAELMGDGETWGVGVMDGIGTACHEFTHCLGLPDMYDTQTGAGFGTSYWDVMCSGSYNDDSRTPAGYTSYERWFAGWLEPVEIKEMTTITNMQPLATTPEAYILYNEGNRNEYYLLENRQLVDFDAKLYGHGLLILHVDYSKNAWENNKVNTDASHQRMTIVPADNLLSVNSLHGDPWPGTTGNTMLTNFTTPAAALYNNNTDGTKFMNKNIDCISEDEAAMTISFVACRPDMSIPDPDDGTAVAGSNSFTVNWPAVSGATSYELELTEIGTASTDPADALERSFDFSKCYSKTATFTNIGSNLSKYGLSGWSGDNLYTSPKLLKMGTTTSVGRVKTATWKVPQSTDMTIVMGAEPGKENSSVNGSIRIAYGNQGESGSSLSQNFEVSANTKQVFCFSSIMKDLFYLEILPEAMMYLNYFAVYDGKWTAEQLGLNSSAAPAWAPLRATKVTNFTTNTNSYTFTNLNTNNRFIYRVRALSNEGYYSAWSESKTFEFGATAIIDINRDANAPVRYFDLSGREVDASARGLLIIKKGNEVRKIIR